MSPIDYTVENLTNGGARRDRTDDLLNANQALFQLSYGPLYRLGPIVCLNAEMMEVKNCKFVLQKLFCVIQDGSSISLLSQAVIDLTVNTV